MTKLKSSKVLLRWVDPQLIGYFALLTFFVSAVFFLSIGIGEDYFLRQLCFGKGCLEEFLVLFSFPLGIVNFSVKSIVFYSAAVGILVAVNNYVETKKVASSQVHLASRTGFENFAREKLAKLRHLNESNVSVHAWYAFMHPKSAGGDLEINPEYLRVLEELSSLSSRTDQFILTSGKGFRHDRYQGPVITKLKEFGFDLAGCSRLEFFSYEREAFNLLNETNAIFCSDQSQAVLKPSEAHRIP